MEPPARGTLPAERRARARRWAIALAVAAVFLVPVSASTSCTEGTTSSACETTHVPLAGLVLGYCY